MSQENFQGYVALLLVTTLSMFQCFVTIIAHSATLINERYVWNHCDRAADMVRIEPFSWHYHTDLAFAIHETALLKHEAIQYLFYFKF